MNRYSVTICGQTLSLVSDENEEYINEIARAINNIIFELNSRRNTQNIGTETRLAYAAIQLADDLFKERMESAKLAEQLHATPASDALPMTDVTTQEKLKALQAELDSVRAERNTFRSELTAAEADLERAKAERDTLKVGPRRNQQNKKRQNQGRS